VKFLSTTAGGYTLLVAVGVVGFLLIHRALKKDVTDTADALQHPFGKGFDDWINDKIFGTSSTPAPAPAPLDPNFGLSDPNGGW